MKILRAEHLGMCFGVRDAIALTQRHAAAGPVTVLGDLVHNPTVIAELRSRGVEFRQEASEVTTRQVIITAHGASRHRVEAVRGAGFEVAEATCPLVHRAHEALAGLVAQGFHPVIVGQRGHVEVRGLAEDHPGCDIVLAEEDVERLPFRPRLGVVSQTTQPVTRVRDLVQRIQRRHPTAEVRWVDTVCRPTKERQSAAEALAARCDVVVVVGGVHSNNTRELANTCRRACGRVHAVQTAADLRPEWFRESDTVGLTAGTSTPDATLDAVEAALRVLSGPAQSGPALDATLEAAA